MNSIDKGEDTEGRSESFPTLDNLTPQSNRECESENGNNSLPQDDQSFLVKYINAAYLSDESMDEMRKRFGEELSVKLCHFLLDEWNAEINGAFMKEDE